MSPVRFLVVPLLLSLALFAQAAGFYFFIDAIEQHTNSTNRITPRRYQRVIVADGGSDCGRANGKFARNTMADAVRHPYNASRHKRQKAERRHPQRQHSPQAASNGHPGHVMTERHKHRQTESGARQNSTVRPMVGSSVPLSCGRYFMR